MLIKSVFVLEIALVFKGRLYFGTYNLYGFDKFNTQNHSLESILIIFTLIAHSKVIKQWDDILCNGKWANIEEKKRLKLRDQSKKKRSIFLRP